MNFKTFRLTSLPKIYEWHRWFAWFPVTIDRNGNRVWLETIERRYLGKTQLRDFETWEYRILGASESWVSWLPRTQR
jgi:hypothetical protein